MIFLLEEPQIYQAGEYIGTIIYIALLIASAALALSQKKPKIAPLDDALQSTATQGAYIPLVIGRGRVGPAFCFVEDATALTSLQAQPTLQSRLANVGSALGFAKGSGGGGPSNYQENALHVLAVGPGSELIAIFQNGEEIWRGPINPSSHPSGSVLGTSGEGFFEIYWGFPDDPVLTRLQNSEQHGLAVRYAYALKIFWIPKNLGPSRQWPRLEYEIRCPCYSQIASTGSEVPLEGDDSKPTFEQWRDRQPAIGYTPAGNVDTDRVQFDIFGYNGSQRAVVLKDIGLSGQNPSYTDLYPSGGIVKLYVRSAQFNSGSVTTDHTDPPSSIIPSADTWHYFWIISSLYYPSGVGTLSGGYTRLILGPLVQDQDIINESDTLPVFPPLGGGGVATPVSTDNSDGINAIHLIDQALFAKYPFGAGRNRGRFDPKSIEVAAEIMQREKIRAALVAADGADIESTLAGIMQDIGLFIAWDVQVGLYVFRLLRYEVSDSDLPPECILEQPTMEAIQGQRPVDVIAFTFRDRARNYREAPLRVTDSGQVAEYETQKARKVPIEVTNDRDSVGRLAPRRQQEVLANLASLKFKTNHATILATPGERFTASATEGPGIQFLITEVQRDINSGSVELDTILDTYNPPLPGEGVVTSLTQFAPPPATVLARAAEQLLSFDAFEVPQSLASAQQIQIVFAASRQDLRTQSAVIWGSRDGLQFTILGQTPVLAYGVLYGELSATSPAYDEETYDVESAFGNDLTSVEDLSLDIAGWEAGKQLMIIGNEVIFLRTVGLGLDSLLTLTGLIRGRAGTKQAFHGEGTPFYVVPSHAVLPLESSLFAPGKTLYYKAQAIDRSKTSDLAEVASKEIAIEGKAFKPHDVSGLRQPSLRLDYDTADDVELVWCYSSTEFKFTGLGAQGFGQVSGISQPRGFFRVEIVGIETFEVAEAAISLDVSTRTSLGLDLLSSWEVRVTHFEGSFASDPVSITLSPA